MESENLREKETEKKDRGRKTRPGIVETSFSVANKNHGHENEMYNFYLHSV